MWAPLPSHNYLIKHRVDSTDVLFFLTDMSRIWKFASAQDKLISIFKESNKALQFPNNNTAITCIVDLFCKDSSNAKREVVIQDENVTITASSCISGYPYRMVLHFQPMPSDVLYKEFTYNLLALTKSFLQREERLVSIIKSKDIELDEYRQEGYEIKRRGVITAPFNLDAFDKDTLDSSSVEIAEYPACIFASESVQNMLSQLRSPEVVKPEMETIKTHSSLATINKTDKEHFKGEDNNSYQTMYESKADEKVNQITPRKKKKTFGTLAL